MTVRAGAFTDAVDLTPGLGVGIPAYILKAANESVTSSTTLQNDDDFAYTFTAVGTYEVWLCLVAYGDTGDIKTAWSVGASVTGTKFVIGPADATTATAPGFLSRTNTAVHLSTHGAATSVTYQVHASPGGTIITEWALLVVADLAAPTFQLQWAQNSSSATATTVTNESYMRITRAL